MFPNISLSTCAVVVVVLVLGHTGCLVQTWITGARTLFQDQKNKFILSDMYYLPKTGLNYYFNTRILIHFLLKVQQIKMFPDLK